MKVIQIHPLAQKIPEMTDEEYSALLESMRHSSQYNSGPIILFEGKILDGRHRYRACLELKLKPELVSYRGQDPVNDVLLPSLTRRDLSPAQKAMVFLELRTTQWGGDRKGENQAANLQLDDAQVANRSGASLRTIRTISMVARESPALASKIATGELTPHAAECKINERERKKEDVKDSVGRVVPDELRPLWSRRGEVMDAMKKIASLENDFKERQKAEDELFGTVRYQEIITRLQYIHMLIRDAQLWSVCPYCSGRGRSKCTACKGRGFITKNQYELLPSELKNILSK